MANSLILIKLILNLFFNKPELKIILITVLRLIKILIESFFILKNWNVK